MKFKKKIVLIKSGRLEDSIRLPKVIDAIKNEDSNIIVISWDQSCNHHGPVHPRDTEEISLKLRSLKGIRGIILFPIWWMFIFFHLNRIDPDIIHAFDIDSIPPAILAGRLRRKPVVYEMIDICEYELVLPQKILGVIVMLDKLFMKLANAVVVVDEMQAFGLGGVPNHRTITIYDSPPFRLLNNSESNQRKDQKFTIFYVGMFYRSKRIHLDEVVEAIKRLDNVKLIIAGYGDMIDSVQEWSTTMPDKVEFIGRISYADVFKVGKKVDLMLILRDPAILANKYTCGSTFLSAMMLGVPVLATKGTSTADKVHEDNSGLVVDSRNVEDIKNAIMMLVDNPDLLRNLGVNAKKAYDMRYNWSLMERRLLDLYRELGILPTLSSY